MRKLTVLFLLLSLYSNAQLTKGFQQVNGSTIFNKGVSMFQGYPTNGTFGGYGNTISGVVSDSLIAWFNPSINITLNSGKVSQWQDISSTYSLVQATAVNQPTYVSSTSSHNQRPSLTFSGSSAPGTYLAGTNILTANNYPVFTIVAIISITQVGDPGSGNQNCVLSVGASTVPGCYLIQGILPAGGSTITGYWKDSVAATSATFSSFNTALNLLTLEINRGTGKIWVSINNSYHFASGNILTTLNNFNAGTFTLGSFGAATGNYFTGSCYDLLFYQKQLSQSEYSGIYNYFNSLYGLR